MKTPLPCLKNEDMRMELVLSTKRNEKPSRVEGEQKPWQ